MKRAAFNLYIDVLAALCAVGMLVTGYVLYFALPPGTNKSLSLWHLARHEWGEIHSWLSLGFLALLLLHLVLHWQWLVAMVAQRLGLARNVQGRQLRSGVIAVVIFVIIFGLFAWLANGSVTERRDRPHRGQAVPSAVLTPTSEAE